MKSLSKVLVLDLATLMRPALFRCLLGVCLLLGVWSGGQGRLLAQSVTVVGWNFGTSSYSTTASVQHTAVSTPAVTIGPSGSGLAMSSGGSTSNQFATTGSWPGSATSMTSGRTSTSPVSGAKVLYSTFTMGNTVACDFSALAVQLDYQRTSTASPTNVRAYLTWLQGGTYQTRYSPVTTLSGTSWVTGVSLPLNSGSAAPTAVSGTTFLLELQFYTVSGSSNTINVDNVKLLANGLSNTDYGDYSGFASASSLADSTLRLGATVDAELVETDNATATGDDITGTDDEDGVSLPLMPQGSTLTMNVNVTNTTAATGYLNGWIDFNQNGLFDPGEQIIADQAVAAGTSNSTLTISFTVPSTATQGSCGARFRITSTPSPGPTGFSNGIGEVEDYLATVTPAYTFSSVLWVCSAGSGSTGYLETYDTSARIHTVVGPTSDASGNPHVLTDLAWSPSGILYGVEFGSSGQSNFYSVNSSTGTVTLLGTLNNSLNGMVFDSTGKIYLSSEADGDIYTFTLSSLSTSSTTSVTKVFSAPSTAPDGQALLSSGDLAWVNQNLYYATADSSFANFYLYVVPLGATTAQLVGQFKTTSGANISNAYGLATDGYGTLYMQAGTTLYTLNATTAVATVVGSVFSNAVYGGAMRYEAAQVYTDYGDYSGFATAGSQVQTTLRMGALVDADTPSLANSTATGDDVNGQDDEDGVVLPASMTIGASSSFTVNVTNTSGSPAYLNGWIDFSGDGQLVSGEQVINNQTVATGTSSSTLTFSATPPAGSPEGPVGARFRLSSTSNPGSTGVSGIGEVEDYLVTLCPVITLSPLTLPTPTVGTAYSQTFSESGSTATPIVWSSTSLPAGLTLNSSTGTIGGTPTSTTSVTFTVTATDVYGCKGTASYTLAPVCPTVSVTPATLPNATVGTAYSTSLAASGGTAAYTFTTVSGTWPAGLTLSSAGVVSGIPTAATSGGGGVAIVVKATDANGCVSANTTINIKVNPVITLSPTTLPTATVGTAYSQTITQSGSTATPIAWSAAGLPSWLAINSSTGVLSGTPTSTAASTFTVTATDAYSNTGSRSYTITPVCPTITVTPTTLMQGTVGTAYSASMSASGGTSAYTWATVSGTWPSGLSMSSAGLVSGTPAAATSGSGASIVVKATDAYGCVSANTTISIKVAPVIVISPATLPTATVGTAYSQTLTQSGSTATPIAWSAAGLPSWLTLNSSTGVLSGTPTSTTSTTFTVTATDASLFTGSRSYTVTPVCPTIALTPTSLANGTLNLAYTATALGASGGKTPYTWATVGTWPTGLVMSSGGVVSGTPTAVTTGTTGASVAVRATDSYGCPQTTNISIKVCPVITLSPTALATATVGTAYSQTFTQSGSSATPIVWSATSLPAGLSLNSSTGVLSGTPTSNATVSFTVVATDANLCTGNRVYSLTPVCPAITVSPTTLAAATVGSAYSQTFTQSGSSATPVAWSSTALPAGLTLNSSTGVLSGVPTSATAVTFTITATDAYLCTGTRSFTLTPVCPVITVTPTTLTQGKVGTVYSTSLAASGGTAAYSWSTVSGTWPAGLSLSSAGLVSGTPTAATTGTAGVSVVSKATDAYGCASGSTTINIKVCPVITLSPETLPAPAVGTAYSKTITQSGSSATPIVWSASGLPSWLAINSSTGVLSGTPLNATSATFTVTATDANLCTGTRSYTLTPACPVIAVSPSTLTIPTVGTAYSQTFTQSGTTATPVVWSSTTLPAGLSLSSSTGVLSGTPTSATATTFTVTVTDAHLCAGTASYTVTPACPTISVSPTTLPGATIGTAYNQTLTQSGASATPVTWSSTTLPAGLTLNSATGVLSGTPTGTTSTTFTVTATDANHCTGARSYTMAPVCPAIALSPTTLTAPTTGVAFSQTISQSGASATPVIWSATGLPSWLAINSSTGVLSGTPTSTASATVVVTATDANLCTGTRSYTITPVCPTLSLAPSSLPNGLAGTAYSQTLTASGGTSPYNVSLTSGTLPAGLSLSVAGVLSGTPSVANGAGANLTFQAMDAAGCSVSSSYLLKIAPVITVSPATLPAPTVGTAYSQTFSASGGTAAYTFAVTSGSLPGWATLNTTTGVISGTPNSTTSATFTITATDATSYTGSRSYTVTPVCPAISVTPTTLVQGTVGTAYNASLVASGGTAAYAWSTVSGAWPAGLTLSSSGVVSGTPTAPTSGTTGSAIVSMATDAYGCASPGTSISIKICPVITLSPATLATPTVGTAYSQTITQGGSSATPVVWSATSLPSWLTLNSSTGVLSGTPTSTAPATFTVTATDTNLCTGSRSYTITPVCPTITVNPATLTVPTVGTAYSQTITQSGSTATPIAYTATGLPSWLALSSSTGVLSGTPTSTASATIVVTATDANLCAATRSYTITPMCPTISVTPSALTTGTLSQAYTATSLTASGGTPAYTWTTVGTWPAGIVMSSAGVVSGTPTAVTTGTTGASVAVKATDANGCAQTSNVSLKICPVIAVNPATLPAPTVGTAYSQTITQSGSSATPVVWSATGLPSWLALNSSTGVLSGTPTSIASATFTVTATDANLCAGSRSYTITPVCPTISLSPTTLATPTVGTAYSQTFTQSGSGAAITWTSTTLPAGLALNSGTGVLSGTPTSTAAVTFTVTAKDAYLCAGSATYTLTPACPTITVSGSLPATATEYTPYGTKTLSASGGTSPYVWSVIGSLPTGLTLTSGVTSTTATVSGTPTVVQSSSFTIRATDAYGCVKDTAFTIAVGCPVITITPASVGPFTQYATISNVTFSAAGGTAPYTFTATGVPAGLTFTPATATLSGTPTAAPGTYSMTVNVTDASGCPGSNGYSVTISCPTITVGTASLSDGIVGTSYGPVTLTATTAGTSVPAQTYTWSVSPSLPAGMSLSATTGVISGAPTVATSRTSYTFLATNQQGCAGGKSLAFATVCPAITLNPSSLPDATVGANYSTVSGSVANASGGTAPYVYALAAGAPSWLSIDSGSGQLSGTPAAPALGVSFTVTATDKYGCPGSQSYTINVIGYDYGDYSGFANAASLLNTSIRLGALVDAELTPVLNATATGDNITGLNDEDGVTLPSSMLKGNTATVVVNVTNTSGAPAYLNGWIDFNNNGVLTDAGEQIVTDRLVPTGTSSSNITLTVNVPAGAVTGTVGVRFRITSTISPGPTGTSGSGEVEDYIVSLVPPMSVGNLVWYDINNNGARDAGEPGISGVGLQLFTSGQNPLTATPLATTTSDANGAYVFSNLWPGQYFVYIPTPHSWYPVSSSVVATTDNGVDNTNHGSQTAKSQPVTSPVFTLTPGAEPTNDGDTDANTNLTMDFGFAASMTIGNLVWNDANDNGVRDANEVGIGGVKVQLFSPGPDGIVGTADDVQIGSTATTTIIGTYQFTNLLAGQYYVKVLTPTGYGCTSGTPATTDNGVDNTNHGSQPGGPTTSLYSPVITLAPGTEPVTDGDTDPNTNMTVDFGLFTGFTVGNSVWYDANNNGVKDANEVGINAVTVELLNSSGASYNPPITTLTNSSGAYGFTVYTPGTYKVKVTPSALYPLASSTVGIDDGTDNDNDGSQPGGAGTASTSFAFTLTPDGEPGTTGTSNVENTIDFGFRPCPTIVISPATVPSGNVWSAYSQTLTASGGVAPYAWSVTSGTLPAGLTLSSGGVISGTPAASTSQTFIVQAVDAQGCSVTQSYTMAPLLLADYGDYSGFALASSLMNPAIRLGALVDAETTPLLNATATGDNITGLNDEDGVTLPSVMLKGNTATVLVNVTNTSGAPAYLNGWIDFNNNGILTDAGEQIVTDQVVATGTSGSNVTLTVNVPSGAATGMVGVRFRISSTASPGPTGASGYGEVEDYIVNVQPTLSIGNLVWNDTNNNGTKDASESGLANAVVRLYTPGPDGLVGTADDVLVSSQTTTSTGAYLFSGLAPGVYFVRVTPPASNYIASGTPARTDDGIDNENHGSQPGGSGTYCYSPLITLANGAEPTSDDGDVNTNLTMDFGLWPGFTVGNLVWNDQNNDGQLEVGEPGIAGATVQLVSAGSNNVLQTTTTTSTGAYSFYVTQAGSYYVQVTPLPGYELASSVTQTSDNGLSNYNTGSQPGGFNTTVKSYVFSLAAGMEPGGTGTGNQELTIDFGLHGRPVITISPDTLGTAYVDTAYSQPLIATGGTGTLVWSLSSGTLPAGISIDPASGVISGTAPATASSNPVTVQVTDGIGGLGTKDYVLNVVGLSIGNLVWNDLNGNGVRDAGEPGVAGAVLQLYAPGPDNLPYTADDVPVGSPVTSGADGSYLFANLPAGKYWVQCSPTGSLPLTSGNVIAVDDSIDNENKGRQPGGAGTPLQSPVITLAAGREPTAGGSDGNANLTVDFALFQGLSIGNLVWNDLNSNGARDAGEPGVGGVLVQLFSTGADGKVGGSDDQLLATTTTDSNGGYLFSNLEAGTYYVRLPVLPATTPLATPVVNATDNGVDNVSHGIQTGTDPVYSPVITLSPGHEPGGAGTGNADLTVDFGLIGPSLGAFTTVANDDAVQIYDPTSGAFCSMFNHPFGNSNSQGNGDTGDVPYGIEFGPDGNWYVCHPGAGNIRKITPAGVDQGLALSNLPGIARLNKFAFGPDGNFYALDQLGTRVIRYAGPLSATPGAPLDAAPYTFIAKAARDIAFGPDANLYLLVPAGGAWQVERYNAVTGAFMNVIVTAAQVGALSNGGSSAPTISGIDIHNTTLYGITTTEGNVFKVSLSTPSSPGVPQLVANVAGLGSVDTEDIKMNPANGLLYVAGYRWIKKVNDGQFLSSALFKVDPSGAPAGAVTYVEGVMPTPPGPANETFPGVRDVAFGPQVCTPAAICSIGSQVWSDLNYDGQYEAGEPGIANVRLELWYDANNDLSDGAEQLIGWTYSDAYGNYLFDGLVPGRYQVAVSQSNFNSGGPLATFVLGSLSGASTDDHIDGDNNGDHPDPHGGAAASPIITLGQGAEPAGDGLTGTEWAAGGDLDDLLGDSNGNMSVDFAFTVSGPLGIGNLVFFDANGNGHYDPGEGIDGVHVELYASSQTPGVSLPLQVAVTANGGAYLFSGLVPGTYVVFIPPSEFGSSGLLRGMFSLPAVQTSGDDDVGQKGLSSASPQITGIRCAPVVMAPGMEPTDATGETGFNSTSDDIGPDGDGNVNLTIDFGFYQPLGVGNLVFFDVNGNGVADSGEGVPGVTVELYQATATPEVDSPVGTRVTDSNGEYLFMGLQPGFYRLHIPSSMFQPGQPLANMRTIAAGLFGDDDVGQDGLGDTIPVSQGVSTAEVALFAGLCPTAETGETGYDSKSDDANDASVDLTIDFGFQRPVSIGNLVYFDANNNGHYDDGEGVAGVTVELYTSGSVPDFDLPAYTTATASNGHYRFSDLAGGSYFVHVPPNQFQQGGALHGLVSMPGVAPAGADDSVGEKGLDSPNPSYSGISTADVVLLAGSCPVNSAPGALTGENGFMAAEDDDNDSAGDMTIDLGFAMPGTSKVGVGNAVYTDLNGNGTYDPGEGVAGVRLLLYPSTVTSPSAANALASTTTDAGGGYYFGNLDPGIYYIVIPGSNFSGNGPLAGQFSLPGQGGDNGLDDDTDENGDDPVNPAASGVKSTWFNLQPGVMPVDSGTETGKDTWTDDAADANSNLTIDFGFYTPVGVGNLVYLDANGNGHADAGEGVGGVTVQLFRSTDDYVVDTPVASLVTSTTSATKGSFMFTGLLPGSYYLHIPAAMFASGGPLSATVAMPVAQVSGDDNTGQKGLAPTDIVNQGISTAVFALSAGTEPYGTQEGGLFGSEDDAATYGDKNYDLTQDFGFLSSVTLGNLVFLDANSDGIYTPGVDVGVPGVTVQLYRTDPGLPVVLTATTITDSNGAYSFNVLPGPYYVAIPASMFQTGALLSNTQATLIVKATNGSITQVAADNGTPLANGAFSAPFMLAVGAGATENLGFKPLPLGVGNLVFRDNNGNGRYDSGDYGIGGITVDLFKVGANALTDTPAAQTQTASDGSYLLTTTAPGSYFVFVPPSNFATGKPLAGLLSSPGFSYDNSDDDAGENGIDSSTPATTGISSSVFTLAYGAEPTGAGTETGYKATSDDSTDANTNLTIDFGFVVPSIGAPLAGRVRRDLTTVAAATPALAAAIATTSSTSASPPPLAGVQVTLYQDTNGNGVLDSDEMAAVQTTTTDSEGRYVFSAVKPGHYLVVQSLLSGATATPTPVTAVAAPDRALVTITGGTGVDNVDFLQSLTPDTFAQWQQQHANIASGASANPDGDFASNLLEYALGTDAGSGAGAPRFWLETNASGGADAVLVRSSTGHTDVLYHLQGSPDLAKWARLLIAPAVTANENGTETLRFVDVTAPFVRLEVELDANHDGTPESTATSSVYGWAQRQLAAASQTFSMPLLKPEVFAGRAGDATGKDFIAGAQYYAEVVGGQFEGRRYEVDLANSSATSVAFRTAGPPADARIAIRAHWTVRELFPVSVFHAGSAAADADCVMFFDGSAYQVLWLMAAAGGDRWVLDGDAALADAGGRIIGPAEGVMVHPRAAAVTLGLAGQVRAWKFSAPLRKGAQLIGSGYPLNLSPAGRSMTSASGFAGSDSIRFWLGDTIPSAAYNTYIYRDTGVLSYWSSATGQDVSHTKLFEVYRAAWFISNEGTPTWLQPVPWRP